MKAVIVYASTHQGNTKKVIDAIKAECDIDLIDATKVSEEDLSEYDAIGFASGIYAGKCHQAVLNFASDNLPQEKDVFFITSSAMGKKKYDQTLRTAIQDKNANIVGSLATKGMTTFGPFKIVGGAPKGRPNEKDFSEAVAFVKGIIGE